MKFLGRGFEFAVFFEIFSLLNLTHGDERAMRETMEWNISVMLIFSFGDSSFFVLKVCKVPFEEILKSTIPNSFLINYLEDCQWLFYCFGWFAS